VRIIEDMDLRQHNTQERIVAGLIDCLEASLLANLKIKIFITKLALPIEHFLDIIPIKMSC
jgi:hypothetical protein